MNEFNQKNGKTFDVSSLPQCKSELLQQFWGENYIASLCNNARMKQLSIFSPENNGWRLEDNQYLFNWFDWYQLPDIVTEPFEKQLLEIIFYIM